MVPPYDYGGRDGTVGHQLVEAEACPVALACPEPTDACGEALEVDLLAGLRDPTRQTLVVGKEIQDRIVGRRYVRLLARERGPPERPLALAEQRPDVRGHEPWIAVSAFEAAELGLPTQGVAVVEDLGSLLLETHHRRAVAGHRGASLRDVALGDGLAQLGGGVEVVACGDVACERVVGRGLVRDDVGDVAALQERREYLSRVAEDSYGQWFSDPFRFLCAFYGLVEVVYPLVQVAVGDAPVYPLPE